MNKEIQTETNQMNNQFGERSFVEKIGWALEGMGATVNYLNRNRIQILPSHQENENLFFCIKQRTHE